jgi:hypothetical protein
MDRENQTDIRMRIVIEQPVVEVSYSLQTKDGAPLNPKRSSDGEPLAIDLRFGSHPAPSSWMTRSAGKVPSAVSYIIALAS